MNSVVGKLQGRPLPLSVSAGAQKDSCRVALLKADLAFATELTSNGAA